MYKSYKGSKISKSDGSNNSSILFWLLIVFTSLYMFWAPFQKALFNGNSYDFERPIYSSLVWTFLALLVLAIYFFYKWKFTSHQDLLSLLIWLMPLSFLIAKISEASHRFATNTFYIEMLYAAFFLIGLYITQNNLGNKIISNVIMISGYVIVWFGLLNWFGYKSFTATMVHWFADISTNPFEYKDAVMQAEGQLRLTSVFQYANTYAAFLMGIFLGALYFIVESKKWQVRALHAFMLVPIILSILLTLSRGALVVLPIVMLLILPFIKISRQLFFLLYTGISAVLCLVVLSSTSAIGRQIHMDHKLTTSSQGLLFVIGVSAACAIIVWVIHQFGFLKVGDAIESKIKAKYSNILIPAAALIVGSLGVYLLFGTSVVINLLPDSIKHRVENINFAQHSVLERGTFYKDAVKVFYDYPFFGAGGGAWAALYEKYQNNPYVSRQTHNFFMQSLVETGLVGLLILLGLLIYIFTLYLKKHKRNDESNPGRHLYFIVAVSILVHSIIDFNMSYVYIGSLVFLCLGAMISGSPLPLQRIKAVQERVKIKWVYASLLIVVSLFMFITSTQKLIASGLFRQANTLAQTQPNLNIILDPLNKALDSQPTHPDYASFKIDLFFQMYSQTKDEKYYNEALALIQKARQDEPHNRYLIDKQIASYTVKNQLPQALDLIQKEIPDFSWDITLYEKSISLSTELGEQARQAKDDKLKEQYWNEAFDTYNKVLLKVKDLESLPKGQLQGRPFNVTNNISLNLGQIEFLRGKYASAENYLKAGAAGSLDDPGVRMIARWYLSSLQKQGKNDQALLDKLIAKDPKEQTEVTNLANFAQ
ncbi:O-antigen ligase family protein [Paenibacillus cremeus]|uniref:O-antigen ligase family protein n=1 Tax=Paenibacillus cremeus TaxID=2163881 RepID=A0A559KCD0_9BACL|nr:O-antigen ligase family protein [Paenibacillus cremeus]TVY09792.1 O-antigen ligase family protein [Paenibacillus cremeus]